MHPQVKLIFKPVHTSDIANNLLQTDYLDLAFITDTKKEMHAIQTEMLLEEEFVLLGSPSHHLNKVDKLTLEEITQETLLLTEKG